MPRSLADWLLLWGAVLAVMAASILTYANIVPGADTKPSNATALLLGNAVAFACALIAIGTDLQNSVNTRLGALANLNFAKLAGLVEPGWLGSFRRNDVPDRADQSKLGQSDFPF
jgi:hypothetical protein